MTASTTGKKILDITVSLPFLVPRTLSSNPRPPIVPQIMPQPALPIPAHAEIDSMLSRRFGSELSNYFAGSPLNRLAFLRTEHGFLSTALKHPSTLFALFNSLDPLVDPNVKGRLAYVRYADIKSLVGVDPFKKTEDEMQAEYNSEITIPLVVFLGLDERSNVSTTDTSAGETVEELEWKGYKGSPRFAVDVTPQGSVKEEAERLVAAMKERGLEFAGGRNMSLEAAEASIFAQSRSILDWNARNPFCASCGCRTLSVNAGYKRICPPRDLAPLLATPDRPPCATRKGVHNIAFPRTDPTIIVAVANHAGTHLLLGRQKRWPPFWYSTLAGFIEPAESVEEAVRREVWEESGVAVGRVVIHSTQPWPYPANLMIGCIAQAVPGGEEVHLKHDPELEDAKWVSVEDVGDALRTGTSGIDQGPENGYKEGGLRLPPRTAIANQLLTAVVEGYLGGHSKI